MVVDNISWAGHQKYRDSWSFGVDLVQSRCNVLLKVRGRVLCHRALPDQLIVRVHKGAKLFDKSRPFGGIRLHAEILTYKDQNARFYSLYTRYEFCPRPVFQVAIRCIRAACNEELGTAIVHDICALSQGLWQKAGHLRKE